MGIGACQQREGVFTMNAALLYPLLVLSGSAPAQAEGVAIRTYGTIVSPDGRPAPGAEVHLVRSTGEPDHLATLMASGIADESGRFALGGVSVSKAGLVSGSITVVARLPGVGLEWVALGPEGPGAIEVVLRKPGEVQGRLTDSQGQPLQGSEIRPRHLSHCTDSGRWRMLTIPEELAGRWAVHTDVDGRFLIRDFIEGSPPDVRVATANHGSLIVRTAWWIANPGRPFERELALAGEIRGQVTCADPLASRGGLTVSYTAELSGQAVYASGTTQTDAQGRFAFGNVVPGDVTVAVRVGLGSEWQTSGTQTVTLAQGQAVNDLRFELKHGIKVAGRVVDADSGDPIPGVSIYLQPSPTAAGPEIAETDESGRYAFFALPGEVQFRALGAPEPYMHLNTVHEVSVEGAPVEAPDFRFTRGSVVHGIVVDEAGKPLGEASVGYRRGPSRSLAWTTDRDGRFSLGGLTPGQPVELIARTGSGFAGPVEVTPGKRRDSARLVVKDGIGVRAKGRVLDENRQPVGGAEVWLCRRWGQFTSRGSMTRTDARGEFLSRWLWPEGEYGVRIAAKDCPTRDTELRPSAPGVTHDFGDLVVTRLTGFLAGHVVDTNGAPVADAKVWNAGDAPKRVETRSGREGEFRLAGLRPGHAYLFAEKTGYRLAGMRGRTGDHDIRLALHRADETPPVPQRTPARPDRQELEGLAHRLIGIGLRLTEDERGENHYERIELVRLLTRTDPGMATAVSAQSNGKYDKTIAMTLGRMAARRSADEACAHFDSEDIPFNRVLAYLAGVDAAAEADPKAARELLRRALPLVHSLTNNSYRTRCLADAGRRMVDLGAPQGRDLLKQAARETIRLRPKGIEGFSDLHYSLIAELSCDQDLDLALQVAELVKAKSRRDRLFGAMAFRIADKLPERADDFLRRIDDERERDGALAKPCWKVAATNPEQAETWLRRISDQGHWKSQALVWMAGQVAENDRTTAVALASRAGRLQIDRARGPGDYDHFRTPMIMLAYIASVANRLEHPDAYPWLVHALSLRGASRFTDQEMSVGSDCRSAVLLATIDAQSAREFIDGVLPRVIDAGITDEFTLKRACTHLALSALMVDPELCERVVRELLDGGGTVRASHLVKWALGDEKERNEVLKEVTGVGFGGPR